MNIINNKIFLAGDKIMLEMYFKQHGFTYSVCAIILTAFTKIR